MVQRQVSGERITFSTNDAGKIGNSDAEKWTLHLIKKNHRSEYKTKNTKNIKLLEKTGDNIFMIPG